MGVWTFRLSQAILANLPKTNERIYVCNSGKITAHIRTELLCTHCDTALCSSKGFFSLQKCTIFILNFQKKILMCNALGPR